jgi:hypothetical protein
MSLHKEELYKLIDNLQESSQKAAYEYLQYLLFKQENKKEQNKLNDHSDILDSIGILTREEGERLMEEVKRSREEW